MIEAEHVLKSYGQTVAVNDVSFSIGKGEVLGLLGPNGAGKTTLMKVLTGYHFPQKGRVVIAGNDLFTDTDRIKSIIGYLPENAPLYNDLNVFEYMDFMSDVRKIPKAEKDRAIEKTIQLCGLQSVVYKPIDQLSKGFRQRVGLAQAIIHDPDILILDEPTTGLDPHQILEIRKLIAELGSEKTVILSTHILQEVEAVCGRILIMNNGTIAASGTTGEIRGKLEGEEKIAVTIKGEIPDFFRQKLTDAGILSVSESEKHGATSFVFSCDNKETSALNIFDTAVEAGVKIIEMKMMENSLEEVFLRLTAGPEKNDE